jgi:hypothetical protein
MNPKELMEYLRTGDHTVLRNVESLWAHPPAAPWMLQEVFRHVSKAAQDSGDKNAILYSKYRFSVCEYLQQVAYPEANPTKDKDILLKQCIHEGKQWCSTVDKKYFTHQPYLNLTPPSTTHVLTFAYYNTLLWSNVDPEDRLIQMPQDQFNFAE